MHNVDTAIMKSQSQTWGEKTTEAEQATPPGTTQTSPRETAATESPHGNNTAPKRLRARRHNCILRPHQHFRDMHLPKEMKWDG